LPEHTLEAKALAASMGADYLEQDVVATSDGELVVLHDIHLDRVTNVAEIFAGRCRDDGRYYVRDFSLHEIRQLTVHERQNADGSNVYPGRYQGTEKFRVLSFSEELELVATLSEKHGRLIGVYPEIKSPKWHKEDGFDMTPSFLSILNEHGYGAHGDPIYVQCFDADELVRVRNDLGCEMKLIQLIGENSWGESDTDYNDLKSEQGLSKLAKIVDGVGPWIEQLYSVTGVGPSDSGFVEIAHENGLAVHPYTFRQDDLPPGFADFNELMAFAICELSIDGVFTDYPDLAKLAISR